MLIWFFLYCFHSAPSPCSASNQFTIPTIFKNRFDFVIMLFCIQNPVAHCFASYVHKTLQVMAIRRKCQDKRLFLFWMIFCFFYDHVAFGARGIAQSWNVRIMWYHNVTECRCSCLCLAINQSNQMVYVQIEWQTDIICVDNTSVHSLFIKWIYI